MADVFWGGTTTDWNTATNWVGGSLPGSADDVHFTGGSQFSVIGITPSNTALGSINIHPDYTGSVGSSGSKMILSTVTDVKFVGGGGRLFLDATITRAAISGGAGVANALELDGAIADVFIDNASGGMLLTSTAAPVNIYQNGSPNWLTTIGASITTLDTIQMDSGRIINSSLVNAGAKLVLVNGGQYEQETGALIDVYISQTGHFLHTANANITNVYGTGPNAVFDGRRNRNTGMVVTLVLGFSGFTGYFINALDGYTVTAARRFGTARIEVAEAGAAYAKS